MYFGYGIRNSSGGKMDSEKRQLNNSANPGQGNSRGVGSYVNSGFDVQTPGTQVTTTTIVVTTHSNIVQ